jgi:dTDP-4-dehydrorhamnose reductase
LELYRYSTEGICSCYNFIKAIFELKKLPTKASPIEGSQYPTAAKRPFFSVLNKSKIKTNTI